MGQNSWFGITRILQIRRKLISNVRLTGLEEKVHYQDEEGNVYSGDMLMNLGLPIQW